MTSHRHPLNGKVPARQRGRLLVLVVSIGLLYAVDQIENGLYAIFYITAFVCLATLLRKWHVAQKIQRSPSFSWLRRGVAYSRALHVRQIRGMEPLPLSTEPCVCINCGHTFVGNFCTRCGQSREVPRFELRHAAGNLFRTLFRVDGKFVRTLFELIYRPGYLINDFLLGHRVPYTQPLATLFLMTAFSLLTLQFVSPHHTVTPPASGTIVRSAEAAQPHTVTTGPHTDDNPHSQSINIGQMGNKIGEQIDNAVADTPFLDTTWTMLKEWSRGNRLLKILLVLPLFSLSSWLTFRQVKTVYRLNVMEHLLAQSYIFAQFMMCGIIIAVTSQSANATSLFHIPIWFAMALYMWDFRQLFRLTWWQSFGCTILLYVNLLLLVLLLSTVFISLSYIAYGPD